MNSPPTSSPSPATIELAAGQLVRIHDGLADLFAVASDELGARIPVETLGPSLVTCSRVPTGYRLLLVSRPTARVSLAQDHEDGAADVADVVAQAIAATLDAEETELTRLVSRRSWLFEKRMASRAALIRVMDDPDAPALVVQSRTDEVDAALDALGAALGVAFPRSPTAQRSSLAERIGAAGCRARTVRVEGQWWMRATEAFIGFDSEETPVAIVPSTDGSYRCFNPSTGRWLPIEQAAAGLSETAIAVTRPWPRNSTSARALVRFAFSGSKWTVRSLLFAGFLAALAGLATPLMTTLFFNLVIPQRSGSILAAITALLVGAAAAVGLLTLTQNLALLRLQGVLQQELEPSLWNRMLRLPSSFFRQFTTGDLVNRVQGIDTIRQLIGGSVLTSLFTAIFASVNLGLLLIYDIRLGFMVVLMVVSVLAVIVVVNARNIRHQRAGFQAAGRLNGFLYQVLGSVSKIRVAGAEQAVTSQWNALFRDVLRTTYEAGRVRVLTASLTAALASLVTLIVVALGSTVLREDLNSGIVMGFLAAAGSFTAAVASLTFSFGPLGACVPLFERIQPIVTAPLEQGPGARDPGRLTGRIDADRVSFRYSEDGPLIFSELSLTVLPGEFLAITGPSGSGKSSLIKVLLGLERPESGSVSYDGLSLEQADLDLLRRQIGVVMQEARPMPGAIIDAVVGDTGCSEKEAWAALAAVGLANDVAAMPMGLHTVISSGSGQLSGGQLQRILLARAIVTKPRIVFLDEATSALDNISQRVVSDSMDALSVTRIVIAHRLETIRHADRIVVIDGGAVVQEGSFAELAGVPGVFQDLVRRQSLSPLEAETA